MGSWSGIQDIPAGSVPSGATLLAWSTLLKVTPESYYVEKANDESSSSTTLSSSHDADLQVVLAASATYKWWAHLIYNAGTAVDVKSQLSLPASATAKWAMGGLDAASTTNTGAQNVGPFTEASTVTWGGTGIDAVALPTGRITTSSTAGTFQIQWAPAAAGTATVKAGSHLWVVRVA